MKNFFVKSVFASALGIVLVVMVLFGLLMMAAMFSGPKKPKIKNGSLLVLDMEQPIPELSDNLEKGGQLPMSFSTEKQLGLYDMVRVIEHAKDDKKIAGILLQGKFFANGQATTSRLRRALEDFKTSGKFVVAHSTFYSQKAYHLATVADELYLNPMGNIELRGFSRVIPFYKETLDKIGVKAQVFYAGKFKSATEPFRYTEMSEPSKIQTREYINGMYDVFVEDLAEARDMSTGKMRELADTLFMKRADQALQMGLIDTVLFKDQLIAKLKTRMNVDVDDDIPSTSMSKYFSAINFKNKGKEKVAVVFAEGTIVDGKGKEGKIGDERYGRLLRKMQKDENIKAVVLRVNSPGGSGLASENILQELRNFQNMDIPVVVSMGDVAASGGYYIACASDKIYAEPNTITGSIGVFAMIPNMAGLMEDKLGMHFDSVKTNENAVPINTYYPIEGEQAMVFQSFVDSMYSDFLGRVSATRSISKDSVHAIAQGRVWTGRKALELGLVDELGDLDDAIAEAAKLANIDSYRVSTYPSVKDPMQRFIEELTGQGAKAKLADMVIDNELGELAPIYHQLKEIKQMKGIQMLMPFHLE